MAVESKNFFTIAAIRDVQGQPRALGAFLKNRRTAAPSRFAKPEKFCGGIIGMDDRIDTAIPNWRRTVANPCASGEIGAILKIKAGSVGPTQNHLLAIAGYGEARDRHEAVKLQFG